MVTAVHRALGMFRFTLAENDNHRKNFLREFCFYTLAAVMAFHFCQLRFGMTGQPLENNIRHLMDGTAYTPFQYRVLIPWFVNLILEALKLFSGVPTISPDKLFQSIELLTVFLLFVAVRHYVSVVLGNYTLGFVSSVLVFHALLFSYVMPRAVPLWYVHWFPFDIPAVLFVTAGLFLIHQEKWVPYYFLFLVATLNRETSFFLTLIYLLTNLGKGKAKQLGLHCLAQFLIWATVKYVLFTMYINNPVGDSGQDPDYAAWHIGLYDPNDLGVNLRTLTIISEYPFIFSIVGYLWLPAALLVRMIHNDFVKRTMVVIVPWCASILYVGTLTQLRIFGELIPIVVVAFITALKELLSVDRDPLAHR